MDNKIEEDLNEFEEKDVTDADVEEESVDYLNDDYQVDAVENYSQNDNTKDVKKEYRLKMIKLFGIVIVVFIVIVLIAFIFSLLGNKKYTYVELEEVLKQSAREYFNDNKDKLPSIRGRMVEITDDVLVASEYMKPLSNYMKNESCSGKVVVENTGVDEYSYTAYLDCGESYQTKELYKEIVNNKNIVTTGYGLYAMNGEYIYRGKDVNNYIKFKNSSYLWRIVKVTKDNEIVLIQNERSKNSYKWDDRYNSIVGNNTGINTYENSNINTVLDALYRADFNEEEDSTDPNYYKYVKENNVFKGIDKSKLKEFDACVGSRSEFDTTKNGSSECKTVVKTRVSLLSVSDFLNVSIDPGCTETTSRQCQNYNYLANEYNYWLANGNSDMSNEAYMVSDYIDSKRTSSNGFIRLVIHLGEDAMIEGGTGASNDPYVIR